MSCIQWLSQVVVPLNSPLSHSVVVAVVVVVIHRRTYIIRGVSKKFGEWYQPENKQNRRYKQINFIGPKNNRHPSQHTIGNIHKASGNCQERPL
jgi:hypothetical protein